MFAHVHVYDVTSESVAPKLSLKWLFLGFFSPPVFGLQISLNAGILAWISVNFLTGELRKNIPHWISFCLLWCVSWAQLLYIQLYLTEFLTLVPKPQTEHTQLWLPLAFKVKAQIFIELSVWGFSCFEVALVHQKGLLKTLLKVRLIRFSLFHGCWIKEENVSQVTWQRKVGRRRWESWIWEEDPHR